MRKRGTSFERDWRLPFGHGISANAPVSVRVCDNPQCDRLSRRSVQSELSQLAADAVILCDIMCGHFDCAPAHTRAHTYPL